jgi:hypothetical protein
MQNVSLLLLVQGILVLQPDSVGQSSQMRAKRLDLHQALNGSSVVAALLGFGTIYLNSAVILKC